MNTNTKTQGVVYELGYHLIPLVGEGEVASHVSAIKSILDGVGAEIVSEEMPIHIELAYPISRTQAHKKQEFTTAYFGWIKFGTTAKAVVEIDEKLRELEEVLRFIIVKTLRENTILGEGLAPHSKEVEERAPEDTSSIKDEASSEEVVQNKEGDDTGLDSVIDELVID